MGEQYDKIIDMLCLTGKMPLCLIESVCNYARKSIDASIRCDDDMRSRREQRDNLIFGDIASFKNDYKLAWYDYERVYADNFSMD